MKIEVSTKLTSRVEKESQKKIKILSRISLIVGIIGLLAYIVIGVAFFEEGEEPEWLEVELYIAALLFALGVVLPITLKVMTKKAMANLENVSNSYVFEDDYLLVRSYRGEEQIAETKHYYKEFSKIKKTKNYLYLYMGIRGAYPIEISALTEEQLSWILSIKDKKSNDVQSKDME